MRRLLHRALAAWFAIAITMAQACAAPAQSNYPSHDTSSSRVGDVNSAGSSAGYAGASTSASTASNDTHLDTTGYREDQSESKALTDYLTQHKLPLVGAQVLHAPDGQRAVVLYGFVGSDFGHSDAVTKVRRYLRDQSIAVDNRIKVRPELLASTGSNSAAGSSSPTSPDEDANAADNSIPPGVQSYMDAQNRAQAQAQAQGGTMPLYSSSSASMNSMLPMLLLGVLGMALASSNSNISIGPGSAPPYGNSPYGGYPAYPSPYGGSPYAGSPYPPNSTSPYGGSPYSGSPYGGSPYGPSANPFP